MVGTARLMRVSSPIVPSCNSGTLKSTRVMTRWLANVSDGQSDNLTTESMALVGGVITVAPSYTQSLRLASVNGAG